jgi:cold shock CspA family protein
MLGTIIWFNMDKGHGFIRTEDDERLYVARDGFNPGEEPVERVAGRAVTFERIDAEGEGDPRAVQVSFVAEGGPPRRARLRSARSGVRT